VDDLTGYNAYWYTNRRPDRKPLSSGFVKRHLHGIVSIEWTEGWQKPEHYPNWSNWTEREVDHYIYAGWLVFEPLEEVQHGTDL